VRPIVGPLDYSVEPHSTVADLLHQAHASALDHDTMIGKDKVDEYRVLKRGTVVFLMPRSKCALDNTSWRETIGMFRDSRLSWHESSRGAMPKERGRGETLSGRKRDHS
jgi:hypothetical protein